MDQFVGKGELVDTDENIEFGEHQIKDEALRSTKRMCSVCKFGELRPSGKPTPLIVYTRDGVRIMKHQYMRCNFRAGSGNQKVDCRAGHSHGFNTYKGMRIYDDDVLKNDILVVSNQTGFAMDFLVENVGRVDISSATFEGLAKEYNRFHHMKLPYDVMDRRVELNEGIINNAYFLFIYLEVGQRYSIPNYQIIRNNLDSTILENKGELMKEYRRRWTVEHECNTPGCRSCVVIDAGLKPHRKVCKALWNGVREYEDSGQRVVTGCTSYPIPNKTYCKMHEGEPTPVADNISSRTRKTLKEHRAKTKESDAAGNDQAYIIEAILDIVEEEGCEKQFKVKWFNFPDEAATLEPEANIPKFIIEYYKDINKLGNALPNP